MYFGVEPHSQMGLKTKATQCAIANDRSSVLSMYTKAAIKFGLRTKMKMKPQINPNIYTKLEKQRRRKQKPKQTSATYLVADGRLSIYRNTLLK